MTARETIISAICSALATTEGVSGRIYRGRPSPARLNETPCIFVSWVNDTPNYDNLNFMDWLLTVKLTVITRSDTADVAADPIINSAHNLLMADRTAGGVAMDLLPAEQRMDIIEGDKPVGMLQALYVVKYRTDQEALT